MRADFGRFRSESGGASLAADLYPAGARKKALIVRNISISYAKVEALVEKAFQAAGFECVAVGRRGYEFQRYDRLVGNRIGHLLSDFELVGDPEWVNEQMPRLTTTGDCLALTYRGVRVGQFVLASALRARRVGHLDFADPDVRANLTDRLHESVRSVIAAEHLLDEIKPDCLLFMDRAYAGWGEIFDLAMHRGLDTVTWNPGYKSNRLVFKRYNIRNQRDHPLCPSADATARLRALPWSPADGEAVRRELLGCYDSEDWFSVVGTQFDKSRLSRDETRRSLGLVPDKKLAVIFPHILWDGSFFYGEDLFQDYSEWFVETIKAACANDRLHWIVKLHPAHVVKAQQEGRHGKPAELVALEGVVDALPPHVTVIQPEAPISTYSLFQIADYVVTVRGTVGIEAALLGIPVITAGTGRYDGRGFTVDSSTKEEYRRRLAAIETQPPMTHDQVERAERYAFYVFLCKPLRLSCASLEYARDGKATPIVTVACRTRDQWRESPDIVALAQWLRDGVTEDFEGVPMRSLLAADTRHPSRRA